MLRRRLMTEDKMDVIHFQDPEVKRILVEHIDTDGDGEERRVFYEFIP